jgi:hypothetical protein
MAKRGEVYVALSLAAVVGVIAACSADDRMTVPRVGNGPARATREGVAKGAFQFTPLAASAVCTNGGNAIAPLLLPLGYAQTALASEPSYADVPDMNTQNETGPMAGRFLYRVHEVGSNGSLSVTDLESGVTKTIAQRTDWEALDPTVWTPWGTLLFAEETNAAGRRDPAVPQAVGGLVYEVSFQRGRSHRGRESRRAAGNRCEVTRGHALRSARKPVLHQ